MFKIVAFYFAIEESRQGITRRFTFWYTGIPFLSNAAQSCFSKQIMVAVAGKCNFISVEKWNIISMQSSSVWSSQSWANTFTDRYRIAPVTIIAPDSRGTNPCIAK